MKPEPELIAKLLIESKAHPVDAVSVGRALAIYSSTDLRRRLAEELLKGTDFVVVPSK